MTSKNATTVTPMVISVATVPDALHAGFRQEWIAANADGIEANLTSGAGLGSPYITLSITREGQPTIYETIDVTDFMEDWISAAIERADGEQA